jgi:hypothetical protein
MTEFAQFIEPRIQRLKELEEQGEITERSEPNYVKVKN